VTVWFAVAVAAAWLVWPARRRGVPELLPGSGAGAAAAPGSSPAAGPSSRAARAAQRGGPRAVPVVEVANATDLLALALRGGVGLLEAVEAVGARLEDPLGAHLLTVAAAQRWGVESAEAWASVPSAWQPAARALQMAATAGIAPADVLEQASQEMRRAEEQRLEVATARLGVRVVLPLGLLFLPAFVLTTVVPIVMALAAQVLGQP
jgi:pilus assembly protein TadC